MGRLRRRGHGHGHGAGGDPDCVERNIDRGVLIKVWGGAELREG